jgi:uncharacterized membrane protein
MEAFSDGVLAIIITIMVLELTAPHEATLAALRPLIPTLLSYVLSFVFVGIYWNNHWLSLIPFVTAWIGETHFAAWPVALYGTVLLFAAIAYDILTRALIALQGRESELAVALGRDVKGKASVVGYAVAIPSDARTT